MVLGLLFTERKHRRCNTGGCHGRVVDDDCTNPEFEFRFGSAIELLVDCWVVAIKLDVGRGTVGEALESDSLTQWNGEQ